MIENADELTALDQAIGDGDHGLNMKRGFEAVLADRDALAEKPLPDALRTLGTTLVMKVGGASGPLYGTLFMALGKEIGTDSPSIDDVTRALGAAIEAVKARGKSEPGQKTMLDVLAPVHAALARGDVDAAIAAEAHRAAQATVPMKAIRGRASFLGDRSIGHMDPGARSSSLMIAVVAARVGCRSMSNVGIVIVSHSAKVAEGAADMVRQMVGDEVPLAHAGGNADGGLGTDVSSIMKAIDRAWSDAGVAILVDLGGAETNSEMAIEMLDDDRRALVVVCNAPIVEGAVIAAAEASGGSSLQTVKRMAEELSPQ